MKVVYSDRKSGKSSQVEVAKGNENFLIGKAMGEEFDGSAIGLDGFKLKITGLSDKSGTPSRKGVLGGRKTRLLLMSKPGATHYSKGSRIKMLVRGNTVSAETEQVNTVIQEYGAKSLDEIFVKKAEAAESGK